MELVKDNELLDTIHELLERKKASEEKTLAPSIPILTKFIESELGRLESIKPVMSERGLEMNQLNELFHRVLNENKG